MPFRLEIEATVQREYDGKWRGQAVVTIYQDEKIAWVVPHGCEYARLSRKQAEGDAHELAEKLSR